MHLSSSLICVDDFDSDNHLTVSISNSNNVFSVGFSYYNSHGHKNKKIFPIKQIKGLTNIKMIDCGEYHCICLNYDGDVFSFGCNENGQLGIGTEQLFQTYIPQKINISPCKQVSCGKYFSVCLTEDNTLYSFGYNENGQLGLGNYGEYYLSPRLIRNLTNVEFIECHGNHSICKTYDNEYYSWGKNEYGQLGQGNNKHCNKPIQCLNWPDNIIDIKSGDYHTLLLTSEGQVYSFGGNFNGQLGISDRNIFQIIIPRLINDISGIQRIECGDNHSMCIDINNNLWLFGDNSCGQLGLRDTKNRYKPILHPTLSNIIDISSGGERTFVKTIDNEIYAFGLNNHSQLGIKTPEDEQLTPIRVFNENKDIWYSTIGKSKQKSARK